jgi:NTP pyrophosphatase (non-canonical NTP hydrolase)
MKRREYEGNEATLDEWSRKFSDKFYEQDKYRSYSEMWLQTVQHAADVAEAIREHNYNNACHNLAEVFCWMSGIINKCNREPDDNSFFKMDEKFSEIVWLKYHNKCPLCDEIRCICPLMKSQINELKHKEKEDRYDRLEREGRDQIKHNNNIKEIKRLVEMYDTTYRSSYVLSTIEEICFHFTEEIGEVAEMVHKLDKRELDKKNGIELSSLTDEEKEGIKEFQRQLKRELADVFSWSVALIIKFNIMIDEISPVLVSYGKLGLPSDEKRGIDKVYPLEYSEILEKFWVEIQCK